MTKASSSSFSSSLFLRKSEKRRRVREKPSNRRFLLHSFSPLPPPPAPKRGMNEGEAGAGDAPSLLFLPSESWVQSRPGGEGERKGKREEHCGKKGEGNEGPTDRVFFCFSPSSSSFSSPSSLCKLFRLEFHAGGRGEEVRRSVPTQKKKEERGERSGSIFLPEAKGEKRRRKRTKMQS